MLRALALLLPLLSIAQASVQPSDFAGNYTVAHGTGCPSSLTLLLNATTIPPASILLSGAKCAGPDLVLSQPSSSSSSVSAFTAFLLRNSKLGTFYAAPLSPPLNCSNATLAGPVVILRPSEDLTIPPSIVQTVPVLNATLPNGIVLSDDYVYVLAPRCVFRREAPVDPGLVDTIVSAITECLPSDAAVTTPRGPVPVASLAPGEHVLSAPGEFSPVIGWTHADPAALARFVALHFPNGTLHVTPGHYVYADGAPLPARSVRPGHVLRGLHGGLVVTRVEHVRKRGLYNPQTMSGDIVVDGVVISTYTEAVPPVTAHALLAPIRAAYVLMSDLFVSVST